MHGPCRTLQPPWGTKEINKADLTWSAQNAPIQIVSLIQQAKHMRGPAANGTLPPILILSEWVYISRYT